MAKDPRTRFMVFIPNYWGMGKTREEAFAMVKKVSCYSMSKIKKAFVLYQVHPKTEVSEVDGAMSHPIGFPPIKLEAVGTKEAVK